MRTTAAVALAIALVVATVGAVPLVGMAQTTDTATPTTAGSGDASTTAPGEQFAGVVGVQAAEVEGEVETRRFEVRLDRASNATERAAIVAEETNETGERLAALRERREQLRSANENGTLSDGQYRARLARLAADIRTTQRMANQSAETAATLPDEALRAHGLNRTVVDELRQNASELSGPEVAEAARTIAGPSAGRGPPGDVPGAGPSADSTPGDERNGSPDGAPDDPVSTDRKAPTDSRQNSNATDRSNADDGYDGENGTDTGGSDAATDGTNNIADETDDSTDGTVGTEQFRRNGHPSLTR